MFSDSVLNFSLLFAYTGCKFPNRSFIFDTPISTMQFTVIIYYVLKVLRIQLKQLKANFALGYTNVNMEPYSHDYNNMGNNFNYCITCSISSIVLFQCLQCT